MREELAQADKCLGLADLEEIRAHKAAAASGKP